MSKKVSQFVVLAGFLFMPFLVFSEPSENNNGDKNVPAEDDSCVVCADLSGANLQGADLSGANITLNDLKAYLEARREYMELYGEHPIDKVLDDLSTYYSLQSKHVISEDE